MAKQAETAIIGTHSNVTFYEVDGDFRAKKKSSLDRKRFFKDKAFEGSRRSMWRLAAGTRVAADVYHMIPVAERNYVLYRTLKTFAITLLKDGTSEEEALMMLAPDVKTGEVRRRKVRVRRKKPSWEMTAQEFYVKGKRRAERKKVKRLLLEEAELQQLRRVAAEYRAKCEAKGKESAKMIPFGEKTFCGVDVKKMNDALSLGLGLRKVVSRDAALLTRRRSRRIVARSQNKKMPVRRQTEQRFCFLSG